VQTCSGFRVYIEMELSDRVGVEESEKFIEESYTAIKCRKLFDEYSKSMKADMEDFKEFADVFERQRVTSYEGELSGNVDCDKTAFDTLLRRTNLLPKG